MVSYKCLLTDNLSLVIFIYGKILDVFLPVFLFLHILFQVCESLFIKKISIVVEIINLKINRTQFVLLDRILMSTFDQI